MNREVSAFVCEKMRERLKDPRLCDLLIPTDYGFGTHRVPLESGYLEVFHRPNVDVVGVLDNPIERITPEGVQTGGVGTYRKACNDVAANGYPGFEMR